MRSQRQSSSTTGIVRLWLTILLMLLACSPLQAASIDELLEKTFGKPDDTPKAPVDRSQQLTIGIAQSPGTMNPMLDSLLVQQYILGMVRRPFTVWNADWKLVCLLCTTVPTLENGLAKIEPYDGNKQRGMAVTWSIKPEARWGDGTPVTTRDVMFTWKLGTNPHVGAVGTEGYRRIRDITIIDDKTFTLHLDRITYDYNQLGGFDLMPAHIEQAAFKVPGEYRRKTAYDQRYDDAGLYNGPYRIISIKAGSEIILEENRQWWGKKPYFRRIILRIIPNAAALQANLLSGSIDMIAGEIGLNFDEALALSERTDVRAVVQFKPSLSYEHIDLRLDNPRLADKRIRQALLYAIDREAINKFAFKNRQMVAHSFVNPLDAIPQAAKRYTYNPQKAEALLDEAGWRKNADGIRQKGGITLRLEFISTSGNRTRELIQQVLQNYWKRIGVQVVIRNQPARILVGESLVKRRFTGLALYAWASAPGAAPRSSLHSTAIPGIKGQTGQNYTGFRSKAMDTVLDNLETELDTEKRNTLWAQAQQIYSEELPALPLFFKAMAFVLPPDLRGLEPTGHQYSTSLWIENWYYQPVALQQ